MREQDRQHRPLDIIEKLMSEIYQQYRNSDVIPPSDTARLIATDILVEIIEKETHQNGRTVIKQLANKIRKEQYNDDFLAALDMAKDILGEDFYRCIPDKVSDYFSSRPGITK
jgi:hypothetical protein